MCVCEWKWVCKDESKPGVQQDTTAAAKALDHSAAKGVGLIAETTHATSRDQTLWSQSSGPRRSPLGLLHPATQPIKHTNTQSPPPRFTFMFCTNNNNLYSIRLWCIGRLGVDTCVLRLSTAHVCSTPSASKFSLLPLNRSNNPGEFVSILVLSLKREIKRVRRVRIQLGRFSAAEEQNGSVCHDYLGLVDGIFIITSVRWKDASFFSLFLQPLTLSLV